MSLADLRSRGRILYCIRYDKLFCEESGKLALRLYKPQRQCNSTGAVHSSRV